MIDGFNQIFAILSSYFWYIFHSVLSNILWFTGVIQNTRVLNYSESHSYVLSVVAEDCGRNKSKPLLVTVEVKQACNTGWTGNISSDHRKIHY